jgi:phosphoribosyl 1,2-cyclic phosphate phosphodiesterase
MELLFLGTAAALQLPSFHCTCQTCETLRREGKKKTRSSLAVCGEKTVLIDPDPDIVSQLERERIRQIDAIFITHWHYDHIGGLGEFGEPASIEKWPKITLFLHRDHLHHMENELAYLTNIFDIVPIQPGSTVRIGGILFEAVKTTHTPVSMGYILEGKKKYAYLVDGIMPPEETRKRVRKVDCVILEATMDELDAQWMNLDLQGALEVWNELGTEECILTHMSFHSWRDGTLVAGYTESQRRGIEKEHHGLTIAFDGMRVPL